MSSGPSSRSPGITLSLLGPQVKKLEELETQEEPLLDLYELRAAGINRLRESLGQGPAHVE